MCPSSKISFSISVSKIVSNHLSPYRKHYQGLPKLSMPQPNFGIRYGGFYEGAKASC